MQPCPPKPTDLSGIPQEILDELNKLTSDDIADVLAEEVRGGKPPRDTTDKVQTLLDILNRNDSV